MSTPSRPRNACPLCGRPAAPPHGPFCSPGCRDRDLLQWLGDGYRLPDRPTGRDAEESDGDGVDSTREPPL